MMYRGQEPTFCRSCGANWPPGAGACADCGEPAVATASEGAALPSFTPQSRVLVALTVAAVVYGGLMAGELHAAWTSYVLLETPDLAASLRFDRAVGGWFELALVRLGVYIALVSLFGVWLVRAGRNLRARGILDTRETDETRLLWFFVPLVNLYRPLAGLGELWRGSVASDPGRWAEERTPALLPLYWGLWIASVVMATMAVFHLFRIDDPRDLELVLELSMGWLGLRLACLPLFLLVVHRIDRAQRANRPGR